MNLAYLIHLGDLSGGILWVLLGIAFMALVLIIERWLYLRRISVYSYRLLSELAAKQLERPEEQRDLMDGYRETCQYRLLETAMAAGGAQHRSEDLSAYLEERVMEIAPTLERGLWALDTIITMGPLLGLLGTIIGIFQSFSVLSQPGTDPTAVTGGVAGALVSTGAGICVALLSMGFYNALSDRSRQVLYGLERIRVMLVNRLARPPLSRPTIAPNESVKGSSDLLSSRVARTISP